MAGRNGDYSSHLAVAILPDCSGIGGSQDHEDQDPRADEDTNLTPRITETAKGLWLV